MVAKSALYLAALAALSMAAAQNAAAADFIIPSDPADQNVLSWATADGNKADLPVGSAWGSQDRATVFVFQLPALVPGEVVTGATFKAFLQYQSGTPDFNVDLYVTGVRATTDITTADFGSGPTPAVGTLIEKAFITPATGSGYVNTSATGDAAVLSYFTSNYAGGNYLVVRANADYATMPLSDANYVLSAVERAGGTEAATLTLTTAVLSNPGWNVDGNGQWSNPANWIGMVPHTSGDTANLTKTLSNPATITLANGTTAIGTLNVDSGTGTGNGYLVSGWGTLKFQTSSGSATINVNSGHQAVTPASIEIASNTTVTTLNGSSLTLGGIIGGLKVDAGQTLSFAAGSNVSILGAVHTETGASIVLAAAPSLAAASTVTLGGLSSATNLGRVDLNNNKIIVHDGSLGDLEAQIKSGALTSSLAAVAGNHTALGVLTGTDYQALYGSDAQFGGQAVLPSDVLVAYTVAGDTTLNGSISAVDFAQIDASYLLNTFARGGAHWSNGDFNHDGFVNASDFALIDAAYNLQSGSGPLAAARVAADQLRFAGTDFNSAYQAALSGAVAVPEPASLGLLGVASLLLLRRQTRRS